MRFFAELKRRNVFKVGLAYVVGGWLLLQLAEVLSELLDLPDVAGRIVVMIVALGLPIALFFAWAYELTPEGVKRENDVDRGQSITNQTGKKLNTAIMVMMALAIAYLLYDKVSGGAPAPVSTPAAEVADAAKATEAAPAPDSPPIENDPSIAVLPFDNRSRLAEDDPFVEGIHDDLLTNLARIGSLKVISRTSVNRYKGTDKSLPEIADELGVTTVMEGAVQRSGDTVRINVQLIDADTDEHLWAEIYDRELTAENLFAIQSEISEAIAAALHATLTPEESERINTLPTQNLKAYEAYLLGRSLMATRISADLERAIESHRTAVTLDPDFALAWVGLADSYMLLITYGTIADEDAMAIARPAAERALEINDQLGEAHAAMANVHDLEGNLEEAEAAFQRAIYLSPNYAPAYQWLADLLRWYPLRAEERLQLAQKAIERDPNSSIMQNTLARAYAAMGLHELAEQGMRRLIDLDPDFARGYRSLASLKVFQTGQFDEALPLILKAIELDPGNINNMATLTAIYNALDDRAAYEAVVEDMEDLGPDHWWPAFIAVMKNARWGTPEATLEAVAFAAPKITLVFGPGYGVARAAVSAGGLEQGLEVYLSLEPRWSDPQAWDELVINWPGIACQVGWLMMATGDTDKGQRLVEQSKAYLQEVAKVRRIQGYLPEVCHLALGDSESALALIQEFLDDNDLFNWELNHALPVYDLIRDEPRYQAIWAERERRLAIQKANVERMREAGEI